eukprot:1356097-Amorphochlora_amoeboformis.AAC.1
MEKREGRREIEERERERERKESRGRNLRRIRENSGNYLEVFENLRLVFWRESNSTAGYYRIFSKLGNPAISISSGSPAISASSKALTPGVVYEYAI